MNNRRIKVVSSALKTEEEVRAAVNKVVSLQISREKWVAERDRKIAIAAEEFESFITDAGAAIEEKTALIEQWAEAHPDRFGRDRSLTIDGHRLGWRLGNPRAATTGKKVTWATVLERLLASAAGVRARFVRVKHEINKEALIAARDQDADLLRQLGVEVVQTQTFYLDPNRDGQAPVRLAAEPREVAA